MKKLLPILLVLFLLTSCSTAHVSPDYDVLGTIEEASRNSKGEINHFLIISDDADGTYDSARVTINQKTRIKNAKTGESVEQSTLEVNMRLGIVFDGPIRESYPIQVNAGIIEIIK